MDAENEAIMTELIDLEKKRIATGRRNYKKLSEIQTKMLRLSNYDAGRSIKNTELLLQKYNQLTDRCIELSQENNELFWALQSQVPGSEANA